MRHLRFTRWPKYSDKWFEFPRFHAARWPNDKVAAVFLRFVLARAEYIVRWKR